jgi:hypothetical protein
VSSFVAEKELVQFPLFEDEILFNIVIIFEPTEAQFTNVIAQIYAFLQTYLSHVKKSRFNCFRDSVLVLIVEKLFKAHPALFLMVN